MLKQTMAKTYTTSRFRIGDWVTLRYGRDEVLARIVEDRGPIGVAARRLYRIELLQQDGEANAFEVPEDNLQSAEQCKRALLDYLRDGGLVQILRLGMAGGKDELRVWLFCKSDGTASYSLTPRGNSTGAAAVPPLSLHENHVFLPRAGDVSNFIRTFGFTEREAQSVIDAVGTAP